MRYLVANMVVCKSSQHFISWVLCVKKHLWVWGWNSNNFILDVFHFYFGWFGLDWVTWGKNTPPPRKLTWQWKIHHLKMYFLLKMVILQCHVSFQGCNTPIIGFSHANDMMSHSSYGLTFRPSVREHTSRSNCHNNQCHIWANIL